MKLFKFNFYNPFKAHVVQFGDKYLVRRRTILFWEYKETQTFCNEEPYWWLLWEYVNQYCMCNSLAQAVALRDKVWIDPKKKPKVKMKVIHG
jgi:hypothetical protein